MMSPDQRRTFLQNALKVQADLFVMSEACRLANSLQFSCDVKKAQDALSEIIGEFDAEKPDYCNGVVPRQAFRGLGQ